MNRRGFLGTLGKVVAGFTILPPATTYNRIWRATKKPVYWNDGVHFYSEEYLVAMRRWKPPLKFIETF